MNGASCLRSRLALFFLRSISYSAPPKLNRTVSCAGPPSRSSSSATVTLWTITLHSCDRCLHRTHPVLSAPAATPQITAKIQERKVPVERAHYCARAPCPAVSAVQPASRTAREHEIRWPPAVGGATAQCFTSRSARPSAPAEHLRPSGSGVIRVSHAAISPPQEHQALR